MLRFLQLVTLIAICTACIKPSACRKGARIEGIIDRPVNIDAMPCYLNIEGKQFIITDDSSYQANFRDSLTGDLSCPLPMINFSAETLLGLYATGACDAKYDRNVTQDNNNHLYHYKVTSINCGNCKELAISYNWVVVPKLPEGWDVTFEVQTK